MDSRRFCQNQDGYWSQLIILQIELRILAYFVASRTHFGLEISEQMRGGSTGIGYLKRKQATPDERYKKTD